MLIFKIGVLRRARVRQVQHAAGLPGEAAAAGRAGFPAAPRLLHLGPPESLLEGGGADHRTRLSGVSPLLHRSKVFLYVLTWCQLHTKR